MKVCQKHEKYDRSSSCTLFILSFYIVRLSNRIWLGLKALTEIIQVHCNIPPQWNSHFMLFQDSSNLMDYKEYEIILVVY